MPSAISPGLFFERQLDPAHAQPIPAREVGALHLLVIDEDAVGARQVFDLDMSVGRRQSTVHARDEGRVDNEIGPRRAANGLDGAGRQAERSFLTLQDPHGELS